MLVNRTYKELITCYQKCWNYVLKKKKYLIYNKFSIKITIEKTNADIEKTLCNTKNRKFIFLKFVKHLMSSLLNKCLSEKKYLPYLRHQYELKGQISECSHWGRCLVIVRDTFSHSKYIRTYGYKLCWTGLYWPGCSTCPLVFGFWELSHVIYLMLRKKELLAKVSKFTK